MAPPTKPEHLRRRHRIELRLNDPELALLDVHAGALFDGNRRAAIIDALLAQAPVHVQVEFYAASEADDE